MSSRKFSIIIACEHSPASLRATLKALAEQNTDVCHEIIVIDNGGYEGRDQVINRAVECGLPVRYMHLPDIERAVAWNTAARESSCSFLAFLDDDCEPPAGWLSAMDSAFDNGDVGIIGGPDRVPSHANLFERCMDYVLTSFLGTVGSRAGGSLSAYHPRPWNMAVRKEAFILGGGFDELCPEAPEVHMAVNITRIRYLIGYQPDAFVWHQRETDLVGFISRDYRLAKERGMGVVQPGMSRIYAAASLMLLGVLGISTAYRGSALSAGLIGGLAVTYAAALVFSLLHSFIRTRSAALALLVPPLMVAHHAAHISGYICGKVTRNFFAR